jgi:hypothetical protein
MTEWLCCLARTTEVLCSNIGATRYRMTLGRSLTAVCLGSSRGTPRQDGLLFRATASSGCMKNIGLSKLSPNSPSTQRRDIRSFYLLLFSLIVLFGFESKYKRSLNSNLAMNPDPS